MAGEQREAGTLVYRCSLRSEHDLVDRPLTWPTMRRLAHDGWNTALPRPAPSAGVPLDVRLEHMFFFVKSGPPMFQFDG